MPARRVRSRRSYYKKRRTRRAFLPMQRREIGEPKTKGNCLSKSGLSQVFQMATRTLGTASLTNIDQGQAADNRERNHVFIKGFRINFSFRNLLTSSQVLHLAVIAPRDKDTVNGDNFFRAYTGEEGHQFGSARTSLEQIYDPINTDTYAVLAHKRYRMAPATSTEGRNLLSKSMYVKLNRQVTYESILAGECKTPVFFVYWCDTYLTSSSAIGGGEPIQGSANAILQTVTFFTNMNH